MHQLLLHNSIVRTVYYPTWGGMILTEAQFPYCGAETAALRPKRGPAAARPVPRRQKRGLKVCMSRTRDGSRRLETAARLRAM